MIGINVDGRGAVSAVDLVRIGAQIARCDTYPDYDLTRWIAEVQAAGIDVCLVLGSTALTHDAMNWPGRLHHVKRRYGGRGVAFQIGNEPDAGWEPGHPSDWHLDERRAAHPSSWIQSHGQYQYLLECAMVELDGERRIGAGLCSGHAGWANGIRWDSVHSLAIHPYAKEPSTPELDAMIAAYASVKPAPLWVTECHARTRGLAAYLHDDPRVDAVLPFCYTDGMVPGFGLIEDSGALADYLAATNLLPVPPVVTPPPAPPESPAWQYHLGDGLAGAILARGEKPIGPERYMSDGMSAAPTSEALYLWVVAAKRAKRIPWESV